MILVSVDTNGIEQYQYLHCTLTRYWFSATAGNCRQWQQSRYKTFNNLVILVKK